MIRCRWLAESFPVSHAIFHSFLAACFMTWFCADFMVFKDGKMSFGLAASLAALSASSLPMMPICPGIQISEMSTDGSCCCSDSSASSTEVSIDWPDCCPGFTVAFIAGWLSVYMTHFLDVCMADWVMSAGSLMAASSVERCKGSVELSDFTSKASQQDWRFIST